MRVDVIVRGIKAGLPLGDCLRIIANETQEPVRSEFRAIIDTQAIGIPIGEACVKLAERVPVPEASFFGIVVSIQQKAGGNLSEALGNLSNVLRERKRMAAKFKQCPWRPRLQLRSLALSPCWCWSWCI